MKYLTSDGEVKEMEEPFLRTPFNYDTNAAGDSSGLECLDKTRTQQQFADEVDINTIVRRFGLTGELPQNFRMPESGDFVDSVTDFHTALCMVKEAEGEFGRLPADLRERFNNDPGRLMDFLENPENRDEARKLKLLKEAEVPPEPIQVRVVPEAGTVIT